MVSSPLHSPHTDGPPSSRRSWRLWATILGIAAVLLVTAALTTGTDTPTPQRDTTLPTQTTTRTVTTPSSTSTPAQHNAKVSTPEHLTIPSIGVDTRLIGLGLNTDGTVEVPTRPTDAGWYNQGTVPGQHGSAVILGHVDSTTGPAVFYSLRDLRVGDLMVVRLRDDTQVAFRVTNKATYANEDFPASKVYAGNPNKATLNLVTCGGDYDPTNGGYQSNVVIYTQAVNPTRP